MSSNTVVVIAVLFAFCCVLKCADCAVNQCYECKNWDPVDVCNKTAKPESCPGNGQFICYIEVRNKKSVLEMKRGCLNEEACGNREVKNHQSCMNYTVLDGLTCAYCCDWNLCNTDKSDYHPGTGENPCSSNPCVQNCFCSIYGDSYQCEPSYNEAVCDPCSLSPCGNGCKCETNTENDQGYLCVSEADGLTCGSSSVTFSGVMVGLLALIAIRVTMT